MLIAIALAASFGAEVAPAPVVSPFVDVGYWRLYPLFAPNDFTTVEGFAGVRLRETFVTEEPKWEPQAGHKAFVYVFDVEGLSDDLRALIADTPPPAVAYWDAGSDWRDRILRLMLSGRITRETLAASHQLESDFVARPSQRAVEPRVAEAPAADDPLLRELGGSRAMYEACIAESARYMVEVVSLRPDASLTALEADHAEFLMSSLPTPVGFMGAFCLGMPEGPWQLVGQTPDSDGGTTCEYQKSGWTVGVVRESLDGGFEEGALWFVGLSGGDMHREKVPPGAPCPPIEAVPDLRAAYQERLEQQLQGQYEAP